mgnify:CR=1 FL=1
MKTMYKSEQTGRSMVEMLGVLAIIGVLSVGGIAGYSKAMTKFKINKSMDQISMLVANIRTLFSGQRSYSGLSNTNAVKFGIIPSEMDGGGGLITLPAYLMAGIPAHLAAGTNKVVNGTGTLVAALKYFRNGKVLLRPAVTAAVCALIGSAVGTELAALISEQTLETLMLVALPCVAVFLSVKKDFGRDIPAEERPVYTPRQELLRSALIGLVFGCYDGLVGPGTGTFMILGFTALLSLDLITAGGCAKASNLASCAASAVVWILHGQVLWALAIPALACSIAGNYLGALYAIRGGSKKIRSVMFLVLGLLFVKMLYELLF